MSTDETIEEFVVLPDVILTTGKKATALARLSNRKDRIFLAKDKSTRGMLVGHIYQIPTKNQGAAFVVGRRKWLRQYEDDAAVRGWQAEQRTFDTTEAEKAMEKKFSSTSQLEKDIEPLRQAYQALAYPQRLAFELYVLSVMRRAR